MILFFYFFIFIISIFVFANKEKAKYFQYLYIFIGFILIIYTAFRDGNAVADYNTYLDYYEDYADSLVEPSFVFISFLVHHTFNNPIWVFIVYAILGVTLKFIAIKQLSKLAFLSVLIYMSYFFILHELTQIRVGVASGMLLLCIKPLYERNLKRFLLYAFIATLFHFSAIIIFVFWFLNPFKINRLLYSALIPIGYVAYFLKLNVVYIVPIPYIQEKIDIYMKLINNQEINVFNLVYLMKCLIFYYFLYFLPKLETCNQYIILLLKLYAISLFSFTFFAIIPVLGFRISELIGIVEIVTLPFIYYTIAPRKISKLLVLGIVLAFSYVQIFHGDLISPQ